jgi:hypothetical protein
LLQFRDEYSLKPDRMMGYCSRATIHIAEIRPYRNGEFTLDASGSAFQGKIELANGRSREWNGWRPDPKPKRDKSVSLPGLWLTDLGLMELSSDGRDVKGRLALRGNSTLEGKAAGRQLDFRFQTIRSGRDRIDFAPDGETFSGAYNTDGFPQWFGWKGRRVQEYVQHVPLAAGKMLDESTKSLLTYTVRAPEGYIAGSKKKSPAVVILHGSNMNGRAYVNTLAAAWPDIAATTSSWGSTARRRRASATSRN